MKAFLLESGAAGVETQVAVRAYRLGAGSGVAECRQAEIVLDTGTTGQADALNPAELLLAALSACMIKSIERVAPLLKFALRGVEVRVHGERQDVPPRLQSIHYEIIVDSDESEQRLALLHDNVKRHGTVFNTIAPGTAITGGLRRRTEDEAATCM